MNISAKFSKKKIRNNHSYNLIYQAVRKGSNPYILSGLEKHLLNKLKHSINSYPLCEL